MGKHSQIQVGRTENALPHINHVTLIVFDDNYKNHAEQHLSYLNSNKIRYITHEAPNLFIRDYGPQFILNSHGQRTVINWLYGSFNPVPKMYYDNFIMELAEYHDKNDYLFHGGNFQTDENSIGYTTRATDLDTLIEEYGLQEIRTVNGLKSDPNNHLDMIAYLASPNSVILPRIVHSPNDEDYIRAQNAYNSFNSWGFDIFEVDTYITTSYIFTYTNALVLNDVVFVPQYYHNDDSSEFHIDDLIDLDAEAMQVYQEAFPGKTLIPIIVPPTVLGGQGSIHCVTLTRPAGG